MQPITPVFTRTAVGDAAASPRVSVFWLMVWAIAILDDSDRREEERRRKRERAQSLQQKPQRPGGPRPC